MWRAVTLNDYKTLLEGYSGIVKATAMDSTIDSTIPLHVVDVLVAPTNGEPPSTQLKTDISQFLDRIKMVTTVARVQDPQFVDVDIKAKLHISPTYEANAVVYEAEKALRAELTFGKFDFGEAVRFSLIVALLQRVSGVQYVEMETPKADIEVSFRQIAKLNSITLTAVKAGG